jgi:F-type H+-transporting ATPase subunit b
MPQLDFATYSSQIFWLLVSFIFLFGFTSGYFLPRFYGLLSSRKKALDDESSEIEEFKKNIELLVLQRKQQIDEANAKVDLMIKQAVDNANQLNDDYEKKINEKTEFEKKRLKESLEKQKSEILKSLEDFIKKTVDELVQRIESQNNLSEPANKKKQPSQKPKSQKKIVNKSL